MKLLLDEMISAVVAEQLRARDRDVEAVSERRELRGLTDHELFVYAQTAQRLGRDLQPRRLPRARSAATGARADKHVGIVVLNPRRFSQGPASIGPLVTSLDRLIAAGAPYESFIHWLQ